MKKVLIFATVIAVNLTIVAGVCAESLPLKKFSRGAVNVLTSPIEIPKQIRAYWIEGSRHTPHIIVWIFSGAVKGSADAVKRLGSGIWDVVSCPWAVPKDYEPLVKPDFVFENWPSRQAMDSHEKKP